MNNLSSNRNCGHAPLDERFGRYVYLNLGNGCWEWRGAKNEHGYGVLGKEGGRGAGNVKAHRLSYQIFCHVSLTPKQCVCHKCDNPACVNPNHLFVGSQLDNMSDMLSKARNSKPPVRYGKANNKAKLNDESVRKIRQLSAKGWSSRKIASLFLVTKSAILSVVNHETWRHV